MVGSAPPRTIVLADAPDACGAEKCRMLLLATKPSERHKPRDVPGASSILILIAGRCQCDSRS